VLELLEKCAKAAAAAGVLFYVTGLIVANQHLAHFDLTDFGSLKPKYVLTGAWAIFVVSVLGFPGIALTLFFRLRTDPYKKAQRQQALLMVIAGGLLGYLVLNLIRVLITEGGEKIGLGASLGLISGPLILCALVSLMTVTPTEERYLNMSLGIPMILLFSFLSLYNISKLIYGRLPESFGGGRPISAELILNKDGAAFWAQTGAVQNDCNGCTRTKSVNIIYQNDQVMAVQASALVEQHERQKLVIIRKALVDGILPVERKQH